MSVPKRKISNGSFDLDVEKAIANIEQADREVEALKVVPELTKKFKKAIQDAKRHMEKVEDEREINERKGRTRSGKNEAAARRNAIYSDGTLINKGIDDAQGQPFEDDEKQFLKEQIIKKIDQVEKLTLDQLRYLVMDVFLDDLRKIKAGEIHSEFHDRYMRNEGRCNMELLSEVRTSLFTNEQREYINGLLQGAFDTTKEDNSGRDINYVEIVMLAETVIRLVKHVHKLDSIEETIDFMTKRSREILGIRDVGV